MDVITEAACGIDVHQKQITVTTLIGATTARPKKHSQRFGTTTVALKACGQWLRDQQIELVLMESTGQYWRPVWQILAPFGFKMILCNPRIIKNIPGKKTDQKDSEWIAELGRLGLVSASFIPPQAIQELRESTRLKKSLTQDITKKKNAIHNILQRSNIKLTTYVTDIFNGAGRKLLDLLVNGEKTTLPRIKQCMHGRMKATPEQIQAALDGVLSANDRRLLDILLELLKQITAAITELEQQIEAQLDPFRKLYLRLQTIPGISEGVAKIIIAEVGADVSPFPTAHHLASWAGLCPGNYESAGIAKSSHITHGNVHLKTAMVQAAMGAKRQKNTGLTDFFYRLSSHMGRQKAVVALAHKLLRIVYAMIDTGQNYQELKRSERSQKALISTNN
ncbi:IS110 family transposase [Loigolactobacillus binensis]|uniref:IS110 family transposase n=1 Tax=Loigolactobacillus binensis TaxID=2559922 RepID=UPI0010F43F80|nr:IS110 family transposase [Loigolactobacillus binensis]